MDDFSIRWRRLHDDGDWQNYETTCRCPICGQFVQFRLQVSERVRGVANFEGVTLARDFIDSLEQIVFVLKNHFDDAHPDA